MISITEAQNIVKTQDVRTKNSVRPVAEALGYCLSQPIVSSMNLPAFDNSAMDGYAVCGYEETYEVIGEVAAGDISAVSLKEGEAVRIFTGGKVPENTTAVIMQEKVAIKGHLLNVKDDVVRGKNIRVKGSEIKRDEEVFGSGQKISPATVATLSSIGLSEVNVFEKPVIRMITTGNELVSPGEPLDDGQIYESNGATLIAAAQQLGFICDEQIRVKDDFDKIKWTIGEQLGQCDVLLLSGGISVGDYDYVKRSLEENGVSELFYKVAQKPGKPLYFGRRDQAFVFALPGNPASALTCFYIYVLPLLQKLAGGVPTGLTQVNLPLAEEYTMKSDRPTYFKAALNDGKIHLLGGQSSAMLHSLALGNAMVLLDKQKLYEENEMVTTYILP
ncbi:molybdopterin molybdotransferase MoeA [Marinoscillum sp. MHG1-6]|uniref:molybdopterin molybdotransferase MoeA n=1 Tax=Marinoscillum sp. MHG1-6 TaxID=2959627 RepID=UPI002157D92B|nr:molybdopterin molybdotransferase MoeA [Marinoscillum sp. MHG1-6]